MGAEPCKLQTPAHIVDSISSPKAIVNKITTKTNDTRGIVTEDLVVSSAPDNTMFKLPRTFKSKSSLNIFANMMKITKSRYKSLHRSVPSWFSAGGVGRRTHLLPPRLRLVQRARLRTSCERRAGMSDASRQPWHEPGGGLGRGGRTAKEPARRARPSWWRWGQGRNLRESTSN